jgi:3-oxoacyl-[acyl-carrier-protein] synthase-3
MARSRFTSVAITAITCAVPARELRLEDHLPLFGGDAAALERIRKSVGLDTLRVVDEHTTAADLCQTAAADLIARLALDPASIDALICVTQTPDHSQPCNAALLHGALGLEKSCASFDVNLGCSGYVYGLWLAHALIAGAGLNRVLVLAGDALSRLVGPRDRTTAILFGDAGSATLIERREGAAPSWFSLHTDGKGAKSIIVPAGGARQPPDGENARENPDAEGNHRSLQHLHMNGAEVFNFTLREIPAAIKDLLAYAEQDIGEANRIVLHQANRYIIQNIGKRLGVPPEKTPSETLRKYGNQSSASIPAALCEPRPGTENDLPEKLVLCGFGVGLSWAAALLTLPVDFNCNLIKNPSP